MPGTMHDEEIRQALYQKVLSKYREDDNTIVIDELGIQHGHYRADIAVINGRMYGYEIKSKFDTLKRLALQVSAYDGLFDRITLVADERHIPNAVKIIPEWWGLIRVHVEASDEKKVHLKRIKAPKRNPKQETLSVLRLLWKEEACRFLVELKADKCLYKRPREEIYQYIARHASLKLVKEFVRQTLKSRTSWRHPVLPLSNGD